jgi:RNA polymerase-associated protein RTF1
MPEFEREAILAGRQEEMQKYKDSQQLDAMYRMAGMGGEEEAESEEEPSRKKRESLWDLGDDRERVSPIGGNADGLGKHTSVSKEASRAMKDLKNKRKAKDERDARRVSHAGLLPELTADIQAQRRDRRQRSSEASSGSDEDGEISNSREAPPTRSRAYSPDRSPVGAGRRSPKRQDTARDMDTLPPNAAELNSARIGRYEIVEMMYKDGFEGVAVGEYSARAG